MNHKLKENSFDGSPAGVGGIQNVQPGLGTFSSPDVSQNPSSFGTTDYNKYFNNDLDGVQDAEDLQKSGSLGGEVDQLFKNKEKPTPDDILAGIDYELMHMVRKDKHLAKERVIANLRKHGPKYYTSLNMLNIDDKNMDVSPVMKERINVLNTMIAEKESRRTDLKLNDAIQDILKEKREMKFVKSDFLIKKAV